MPLGPHPGLGSRPVTPVDATVERSLTTVVVLGTAPVVLASATLAALGPWGTVVFGCTAALWCWVAFWWAPKHCSAVEQQLPAAAPATGPLFHLASPLVDPSCREQAPGLWRGPLPAPALRRLAGPYDQLRLSDHPLRPVPASVRADVAGLPRQWQHGHLVVTATQWVWFPLTGRHRCLAVDPRRLTFTELRPSRPAEWWALNPASSVLACRHGDSMVEWAFIHSPAADLAAATLATPSPGPMGATPWTT